MAGADPRLALVAGEASGDLLASLLLGGLKERWPGLQAAGIGGPRMAETGFEAWWPSDKLAVRGYAEVLRHYRELVGIRRRLGDRVLRERPDAFIGVDAPDFNLDLEARLKAAGVRSVHFISPSIWAWRGERIHKIKRSVDHVLCIFPFEPAIYAAEGVPATYVGHPLADTIPLQPDRLAARRALGVPERGGLVALLPGSRRSEVDCIGPTFLAAAARLRRERPSLRFVLPVAPGLRSRIDELVAAEPGLQLSVVDGRSHDALAACDVTLIASGTATLEAALYKRPMVIAYRMNWISWQIMRRMNYQPWIGLPNILLRDFVVPEVLQHEATPERLAREVAAWLDDPARADGLVDRFTDLHHRLRRDTARAATDAIAQILGR